ncbi:hypothetical protein NUW54_g8050 [Trametes sanguinea]|uniref:Uncharacterized protein n=1 Tax=Trametes sanguinea TaxID=158606 RepID=A0ACC1PHB5_9APHY|nr:hypothetical protein NUW54_g8050 [Trametes sanguinea]
MSLPVLSTLKKLEIYHSVIGSLRTLLDVVWSCRQLTHLTLSQVIFADEISIYHSKKTLQRWRNLVRDGKACGKLTHLSVYATAFSAHHDMIVGALFGSAVTTVNTTVKANSHDIVKSLNPIPFLYRSFPELRSIYLRASWPGIDPRASSRCSLLELLLKSLAHPEVVQYVTLINLASGRGHSKRYSAIPAREWLSLILPAGESGDSPLQSILPSLRELRIVFSAIPVDLDAFYEGICTVIPSISDLITVLLADHEELYCDS